MNRHLIYITVIALVPIECGHNTESGGEGQAVNWSASKDSLQISIKGKRVEGTATFSAGYGGGGETRQGSFKVGCQELFEKSGGKVCGALLSIRR